MIIELEPFVAFGEADDPPTSMICWCVDEESRLRCWIQKIGIDIMAMYIACKEVLIREKINEDIHNDCKHMGWQEIERLAKVKSMAFRV